MKKTVIFILFMTILLIFGLSAQQPKTIKLKGSQDNPYAELHRPATGAKVPLVIFCHGSKIYRFSDILKVES